MRTTTTAQIPKKSNIVDIPIGTDLLGLVQKTYVLQVHESQYWIADLGNSYRMMYSRKSGMVQCYYRGYGHDTQQEWIGVFQSPEAVMEYVESHRSMPLTNTLAVEEISRHNGCIPQRMLHNL